MYESMCLYTSKNYGAHLQINSMTSICQSIYIEHYSLCVCLCIQSTQCNPIYKLSVAAYLMSVESVDAY